MKTRAWHILPLLAAASVVAGCEDQPERPERVDAALQRAESCADLEARLEADAIAKMHRQIDTEIRLIEDGWWDDGWFGEDQLGGDVAASTGAGGGGAPDAGAGGGHGAASPSHSETNTQVDGVDEADIVKTDGNYLYVLHGRELAVVNAYPASDLAIGSTTEIEGHPLEMFLADDKIVVFSSVDGTPLLSEAGIDPRTPDYGYGDCYDCGFYVGLTKVTVMSLDGASPRVDRELYFEGDYRSSRRIGSKVRAVLSGGYHPPSVQYHPDDPNFWDLSDDAKVAAYEALRTVNAQRIREATLSELLPYRFERTGGELSVLEPSCGDYYVPTPGSTEYGMTQIQSFDILDAGQPVSETQVVGHAQTVYANGQAMYLVGQSYRDPWFSAPSWAELSSTTTSHIHKFDIQDLAPRYEGSGSVPGWVNNQFSLDEKDGNLRVTTTDELVSDTEWTTVNHLFVLADVGDELETIGSITGLAPDESVQSARFIGDMGYIVTFRQVDPLFAVDLSDPTKPRVLGELKIPGFSEYMHPLDGGTHLLTIGRDGTDDGQVLGVALQIFDVQNPLEPKLTHKHVLGEGYSDAEVDHKAFTFYQGRLAIPMVRWDHDFYEMTSSSLELFDVDAAGGITALGGVDHTSLFGQTQDVSCYYYGYGVRRGVFIDDLVYSISEAGIVASDAANPASPVATMLLPDTAMGCGYEY